MLVLKRLAAVAAVTPASAAAARLRLAGYGQPSPWQMGLQQAATPVMDNIVWFHDFLLYLITAITLFVLVLLVIVMVRFNARANPMPSQDHAQHPARGGLDADPGRDPGGDRGAVVQAPVPAD